MNDAEPSTPLMPLNRAASSQFANYVGVAKDADSNETTHEVANDLIGAYELPTISDAIIDDVSGKRKPSRVVTLASVR